MTIVETLPVIVDTRTAGDAMFALRKRAGTAISAHANNQYSMLVARLLSSVANLATVLSEPDATDESIAEARDIVDTILSHLHMEMMMAGEYAKRDNGNGDDLMLAAYLHEATSRILPFLAEKINREGDVSIFENIPLADSRENAIAAFHALFGRTGKPIRTAGGVAPDMKYVRVFEKLLKISTDAAQALSDRAASSTTEVRDLMEKLKVQESYVKRHFNFV